MCPSILLGTGSNRWCNTTSACMYKLQFNKLPPKLTTQPGKLSLGKVSIRTCQQMALKSGKGNAINESPSDMMVASSVDSTKRITIQLKFPNHQ
eukprot:c16909_g1_i1 orf=1410-1691(-)